MSELLRVITLQDPNTRVVLLGTTALGLAAGVVGVFVVLRRRALVGDVIAHAALPGIAMSFLVIGERSYVLFLVGAAVFGMLGVASIAAIQAWTRVREDAAMGLVLSSFFGLGLVLSRVVQDQPGGNKAGLDGYIFGKAASMVRADAIALSLTSIVVIVTVAAMYKEFRLVCFDRSFAAAIGRRVTIIDCILLMLVCLCVTAGMPAVGVVLTAALLIIPAAAARFWTERLVAIVVLAGSIGVMSGVTGVALSATLPLADGSHGWPTGAMIVLVAGALFLISVLIAPKRGIVSAMLRRYRYRRRTALEHVLRAAYEHVEHGSSLDGTWDVESLRSRVPISSTSRRVLRSAKRAGYIQCATTAPHEHQSGYRLTPEGVCYAARLVRAHRMWEHFLIHYADVAPDHVHRGADELEHVLPVSIVAAIEADLGTRLPVGAVQRSAHDHCPMSEMNS